jgi:hypothetical protein
MKTKTKPAKKSAARKPLPNPFPDEPACPQIHIHPRKVEFFKTGESAPFSRMPNGAEGSEAYAAAKAAIQATPAPCVVIHFDAQGHPVK